MAGTRQRGRRQPGTSRWAALGAVVLVALGVTFGLGMLVGSQRARQTRPVMAADSPRKPPAPRRHGLTETGTERPAPLQEKLTFYQTLREPLGPLRVPDKAEAAVKPAGVSASATKKAEQRDEGNPGSGVSTDSRSRPRQEMTAAEWTVQVGVFGTAQQAAGVKRQLAQAGFEAQIVSTAAGDGQARYRVRVGTFKSKEEAIRTAERVRTDRSLPTYVTTR
jgi:cell division protein FtsN